MGKNSYFGAVVLLVLVAFLAAVGPAALADGAQETAVGNEPIAVEYDHQTSVEDDGIEYDEDVDVRNGDGDELVEGTDYDWHASTGNVTWIDTAATTEGETARVDYAVAQTSDVSLGIAEIVAGLLVVTALVALWIIGANAIDGVL